MRTTVRENYFKWIFQQLSDIHEVEDEDVRAFQLECDHIVYTDLPKTLVCSHMELTKFPFKDFEIDYGVPANNKKTDDESDDDEDNDSYCSANSVDQAVTTSPNPALGHSGQGKEEKRFFLVHKGGVEIQTVLMRSERSNTKTSRVQSRRQGASTRLFLMV